MIEITELAAREIEKVLKEKSPEGDKALRVYAVGFGWGGPNLGMALDEPSEADEVFKESGFSVVIEKQLLERIKGVKIEYETSKWRGEGFKIFPTYESASCSC